MSIELKLLELAARGDLIPFRAPRGHQSKRALFMTKGLLREIESANSNVGFHKCRPHIERLFERWVKGDLINVSVGGSGKGAMLARLDPPPEDVWELRVTEPSPQFRVFCRFAAPDALVATAIENRSILGNKRSSTGKKSAAWERVLKECVDSWNGLLPGCPPMIGADMNELIKVGKCNVI